MLVVGKVGLRRCIDDSNTWVGVFPENDKQRGQAPPFRPVIVLRFDTTRERRQPNKDTDLDVGMRKNLTRTHGLGACSVSASGVASTLSTGRLLPSIACT